MTNLYTQIIHGKLSYAPKILGPKIIGGPSTPEPVAPVPLLTTMVRHECTCNFMLHLTPALSGVKVRMSGAPFWLGWLLGWSLTCLVCTNTAISETKFWLGSLLTYSHVGREPNQTGAPDVQTSGSLATYKTTTSSSQTVVDGSHDKLPTGCVTKHSTAVCMHGMVCH